MYNKIQGNVTLCNTIQGTVTRVQYNALLRVYRTTILLHVYIIIQCTVIRVQYNTKCCYTCEIQYNVLLHMYNTIQCS